MIYKNSILTFYIIVKIYFINARNYIRGKKHRIKLGPSDGIFVVFDNKGDSIRICRINRHNRSKNGIASGVEKLAREYHLDKIDLTNGDLLVDCGANIGEIGIWARRHGVSYIAIEPEVLEAQCCNLNNFGGQKTTIQSALWNESKELSFYSKPNTADSSLIEINEYTEVKKIPAVRLDHLLSGIKLAGKLILKIEAEGAEPEVLEGAEKILHLVSYVTIDCGYERGKESHHTFIETQRILNRHQFELVSANFKRMTMLYRNSNLVIDQN